MLLSKINFFAFLVLILVSSCATSNQWIEDDVYSMKSAIIPIDTDVNDETDYNAFVYKKSTEEKSEIYVDQYNVDRSWNNSFVYFGMNQYRPSFDLCSCNGRNIYYSPSSFHNQYYANMYGCNDFYGYNSGFANNGYFYNPYYGNGYFGNSYGNPYYGNSYYNNPYWNSNNNPNTYTVNNGLGGPRGSISGFGGVTSRQPNALKSNPVIGRVGKESATSASSINVNGNVGLRNSNLNSSRNSNSTVARPSTTTNRSGSNSAGSTPTTGRNVNTGNSPSRSGSDGTISSPRTSSPSRETPRSGGSTPTRSSGTVNKVGRP